MADKLSPGHRTIGLEALVTSVGAPADWDGQKPAEGPVHRNLTYKFPEA